MKIGEIYELESKLGTETESRRRVATLVEIDAGAGIFHCSVENKIDQEWVNEFVETVFLKEKNHISVRISS